MYEATIRSVLTLILVFGHFAIVIVGLCLLVLFGPFSGTDGVQIVLMASPILAVAGLAAFRNAIENRSVRRRGKKVNWTYAIVVIAVPLILTVFVLVLFHQVYRGTNELGVDGIKVVLGAVETIFGGYIGLLAEKIFAPSSAD